MNRIRSVEVYNRRLVPAEVELTLNVTLDSLDAATRVTGRLVGPRCDYATTVEVAYPMRETERRDEEDGPRIFLRVVIPEASFWEPSTPFLYEGPIELWQGTECCDRVQIRRGLRTITLGPKGLRVNGKLLEFHAAIRDDLPRPRAHELRKGGFNGAIVSMSEGMSSSVWEWADELGFLILGMISAVEQLAPAWSLREHPSVLGWILEPEVLQNSALREVATLYPADEGQLLGIHLSEGADIPLPEGVHFIFCSGKTASSLNRPQLPKLIVHGDVATFAPG
jgi:hypothetical protein